MKGSHAGRPAKADRTPTSRKGVFQAAAMAGFVVAALAAWTAAAQTDTECLLKNHGFEQGANGDWTQVMQSNTSIIMSHPAAAYSGTNLAEFTGSKELGTDISILSQKTKNVSSGGVFERTLTHYPVTAPVFSVIGERVLFRFALNVKQASRNGVDSLTVALGRQSILDVDSMGSVTLHNSASALSPIPSTLPVGAATPIALDVSTVAVSGEVPLVISSHIEGASEFRLDDFCWSTVRGPVTACGDVNVVTNGDFSAAGTYWTASDPSIISGGEAVFTGPSALLSFALRISGTVRQSTDTFTVSIGNTTLFSVAGTTSGYDNYSQIPVITVPLGLLNNTPDLKFTSVTTRDPSGTIFSVDDVSLTSVDRVSPYIFAGDFETGRGVWSETSSSGAAIVVE